LGFNFSSLLLAQKDINDVKKSAERSFNDENYVEAYKLYAQLVANFSKEPMYNYRLGVSMIYAESDKKKCIPYLEFAVKFVQKKEVPPEALFYLGKAYHINYRFDEAIRYYREYKQQVSSSRAKEMEVDKEIAACENGKKLLSNIKELVVLSKKRLNENEYFRSYDLSTIGGKLLVKPDEFQTKYDKKKKDKSIVYLPQTGDKVFFSSYGEDGKNGRDIYYAIRLPNGTFAKPQPLTAVNTPYDEDYPFLHPNGKVLYLASKGHKGMGGYDIFKSTYDPASQTWSSPENLEFPINSPGDDFLFVTDSSEKIAFFSTSRYAPPGQIDVLKIKTERVPPLFVAIRGNVRKTEINQSVRSVITVKDIETGDLVGTFTADENGQYYMELPNGGKFLFTVETPGFTKQSEAVNLPLSYAIKPLRQSISYEKNVLVITNYFDEATNENAYLDIVEFIEKKAQLDVNESQFKQIISPPVAKNETSSNNTNQNETTTKPSHQEKQELSASNTPIPPNNTQELLAIVKKDAEEAQLEAQQLESENAQLKQVIQLKEQEIKDIDKSIADTQNQLNNADTKEEQEQLTQLLNELQNKKGAAEEQVKFFQQYQKEVEAKLINKKKEADLNQQFVNALQELESGKNKNLALKKLEQLQKDLQALEQTNTEQTTALSTLNQQEKEKQQEIDRLEKQKLNEEKDIQLLREELSNLKNELATTKDRSLKENIQSQINERENELKEKENEILALSSKIQEEKEDLQSIQEQKQIIAKIKNKEELPITAKNNTTEPPTQNIITNANINQVNNDYTTKINSAKNDEEKKKYLEEYSQLLMKSIEENNKKISAASDLSQKQKLQNLNSELELLLKENNDKLVAIQNQQTDVAVKNENKSNQIPSNNNANNLNQQTDVAVKNENELSPITNQQEIINTISQNDQIKSEFTTLKKQFENQSYQSPSSASLKENIPQISESNETSKTIINIINANNQSYSFAKQADSLRKLASDLKAKANKTTDNNQKQKLLADAKKLDVAALEKEYQSTQFKKTYHQNLLQYYENTINQLPEEQKQKIIPELTKAKQSFKQAEQLRKEASTQPNLTVKLAAEQNAQEKEQLAITNINRLFKENNIQQSLESAITSIQQETQKVEQNYLQLQNQYIKANSTEIDYLIQQLDTAQKIKNDATLSSSLNQLKEIYKNIESQISSNPSKENNNTIINNQLQLLQQLRQLATTIYPIATTKNDYLTKETTNKIIASNNLPKDTILSIAQKLPLNIDNSYSKQIQTLIQQQKQIEDNLKTENPILKAPEEIQKTNEQLNTEITQLTNKALELKQKIAQTTDQRKKAEIQTEFERTNAQIQEKKIQQITNELLLNQAQFAVQQNYLNQLTNSIPSNKSNEKNTAQSTLNEIQKLKKQEEDLIKEALQLTNPSAQLGALQNARIKQQEYLQQQIELEKKLAIYNPHLKKQSPSININDPLALTLQYQNNIQKQIKEWEAVNNNLNLEITRLYPKYSNTPSGKLLADAQKLISESKTTTDLNKKLELQIKAAQLQQQAMQQLSSGNIPVAQTNTNQNPPGIAKQNQISTTPQNSVAINNTPKEKTNNALTQNTTTSTNIPKKKSTNAPLQNTVAVANNQKEKTTNTLTQNIIAANNKTPNKTTATPPNTTPTITSNVKKEEITNNFLPQIKSVKIARTPAYSDAKPIPLNPPLPDGLIFSVQVGAFKNPLPNNFFNGLSPIFAQTTENNLYRYLVGQMTDPQEAIALKNNFRNLGYTDAFVIAYYKGKRISLSEALDILKKEKQTEPKINPFATTNVLEKANIPTYTTLLATTQQENITTPQTPSIREAEEINDLYFTIQIGVYGKDVSDATFKYIKPIIRSNIDNKFYRYSAGIYANLKQAQNDLNKVIALGMKDAFICAYWNGKRIFYPEAEKLIRENKNIRYAPAQPIQFPNEAAAINLSPNPTAQNAIIETSPNSPPFDPTLVFSNGVTKRPEPTPENGVKADNSGICFRVQIGAFKNKVPPSTAEKYFKIKDWPIEVHYINGLYIYTVGNFVSAKYAAKLREQVVSYGITDAFITVYKNNKKLFGYEALKYMNQQ